jgi:hypothetical protein
MLSQPILWLSDFPIQRSEFMKRGKICPLWLSDQAIEGSILLNEGTANTTCSGIKWLLPVTDILPVNSSDLKGGEPKF